MNEIQNGVANGIALGRSRSHYPAAVICIAMQLMLLALGIGLGGMKFAERTWPLGGFCLTLTTLAAIGHRSTLSQQ